MKILIIIVIIIVIIVVIIVETIIVIIVVIFIIILVIIIKEICQMKKARAMIWNMKSMAGKSGETVETIWKSGRLKGV